MGFALDKISLTHLAGVHPDLCRVINDCARNGILPFTFGVSQGLRTVKEQKQDVAAGKSLTMASRHLDGHAADLVVLVAGKITWAWGPYYTLADQMRLAGIRCKVPLRWGGQWRALMADYTESAMQESAAYVVAAKADGNAILLDGPHYELPVEFYPSGAHVPPTPTA